VTRPSNPHARGLRLDTADRERPHQRLAVRVGGQLIRLRPARTVPWSLLLQASTDWWLFVMVLVPAGGRRLVEALSWDRMQTLVRIYRIHHGLGVSPAEDQRLAALIARYGRAIEQDLAAHGVDLLQLWQQRRWRHLLNLIDGLPRHSAFVEALCDDDDLAEHLAARDTPAVGDRARMPLSQFSPELEMATNVFDRLGELIQAVTAAAGARPPKIAPYPRPRTAADRVRQRRAELRHRGLVARLLPHGPQAAPTPSPRDRRPQAGDPLPPPPG